MNAMRWLILGWTLLAAAGCGHGKKPEAAIVPVAPPEVKVAHPVHRTVRRTEQYPGDVLAWRQAHLYAKVAGYLAEVHVDKGDPVTAGQLLATIDSPEMRRDVQQAQAAYEKVQADAAALAAQRPRATAEIEAAQAQYRRALAQHEAAQGVLREREAEHRLSAQTLSRNEAVFKEDPDMLPAQDLDVSRAAVRVAASRVDTARRSAAAAAMEVEAARSRVKAARSGLDLIRMQEIGAGRQSEAYREGVQRARVMEQYGEIRAPFTGTVTARNLDAGALVQSAASSAQGQTRPIFIVADASRVRIQVQVPEAEVPFVRPGIPAEIVIDPHPDWKGSGRVRRVARALDIATRTMLAEIELPNRDGLLTPGMLAKVRLELEHRTHRLAVPAGAVAFDKDRRFVYVVEGGRAKKRPVKTGFEGRDWVEIQSGVTAAEAVVVEGKTGLGNDVAVTVGK